MKVFDLAAALRGEPVWHTTQKCLVENLTKVGNNVAFTIPHFGEGVYYTKLDGVSRFQGIPVLVMISKTRTVYANLWNSPSFHYTTHPTEQDARDAKGTTYSGRNYAKLNPEPIAITIED